MGRHYRKMRPINDWSYPFKSLTVVDGQGQVDNSFDEGVTGYQVTDSYSNPGFFKLQKAIRYAQRQARESGRWQAYNDLERRLRNLDMGSPFWTIRQHSSLSSRKVVINGHREGLKRFFVDGYMIPQTTRRVDWKSAVWPAQPNTTTEFDLCRVMGAKAIAATAPTVPVVSVANLLGELRNDGLPSLIGSVAWRAKGFTQRTKSAGGEYLNIQFGWKPLVSDILKISDAILNASRHLERYEAESGRNIGRSFEFPEERSTVVESDVTNASLVPSFDTFLYNGPTTGRRVVTLTSVRRYWFEGVYCYRLPLPSTARTKLMRYASEAEKLLGLQLTPEVLWNLAPWTWFSDWFLNFGSVATNLSAFSKDDLMLRRGYVMCHSIGTRTYTHSGLNLRGWGPTGVVSQSFHTEMKMRRKASPWGFGVTFDGFTPRQIAIMAALGVSRDWQKLT